MNASCRSAALWTAVAGLSACAAAGPQLVHSVDIRSNFSPAGFSAFAASGPAVAFVGRLPGEASPTDTAAALRLPGRWPQTPFRPVDAMERGQRIVIAFGAAGDPGALCDTPQTPGETPGRLEASAAYCIGSRVASSGRLSDSRPLVPGDPAFTDSMRALLGEIASSREPFESNRQDNSDDCPVPTC